MPVKWTTWKKGTNLPRINQEEIENMSSLITSNEIETVIKNLPTNRSPGLDGSTGKSYQTFQFSSVQFSRSFMSDSLRPHESQHARPPCPSATPEVYSNSCPSSR